MLFQYDATQNVYSRAKCEAGNDIKVDGKLVTADCSRSRFCKAAARRISLWPPLAGVGSQQRQWSVLLGPSIVTAL